MAEDQNINPASQLKAPYKILNVTITTNDPLTASVLASARSVKRLNAVLGMMLEAYLATPAGQVMAAQQLRIPVEELAATVKVPAQIVSAPEALDSVPAPAAATVATAAKGSLNYDKLCA